MSKLACPRCYQDTKKQVFVSELNRFVDSEGYVAAQVLCPNCGLSVAHRVVQEQPPCGKCGHQERRYLKGDPRAGGIVPAPTDAESVLNALRTPGSLGEY